MIWVIDASVALRWYLEDEAHGCADAVLKACWLTFDKKAHELIEKDEVSCLLSEGLPKDWSFGR